MLLIMDPEVRQVLKMHDCIDAMERAFAEEARGVAVNKPRTRYKVPPDLDKPGLYGQHHSGSGAKFRCGGAALRFDHRAGARDRGNEKNGFPLPLKRSWGFVLLFSLQTGELLALIHDFSMSAIRVGVTTGIANRALAKRNAKVVGILGSGNEARTNLEAICVVRDIQSVKVYSPNKNIAIDSPRK